MPCYCNRCSIVGSRSVIINSSDCVYSLRIRWAITSGCSEVNWLCLCYMYAVAWCVNAGIIIWTGCTVHVALASLFILLHNTADAIS